MLEGSLSSSPILPFYRLGDRGSEGRELVLDHMQLEPYSPVSLGTSSRPHTTWLRRRPAGRGEPKPAGVEADGRRPSCVGQLRDFKWAPAEDQGTAFWQAQGVWILLTLPFTSG